MVGVWLSSLPPDWWVLRQLPGGTSCSTDHVLRPLWVTQQVGNRAGVDFMIMLIIFFFLSMYCYIIVKINILSSESMNTFSSILCQIPQFRNWMQRMFGILKNNLNNQIIIEITPTNFHLIVLYNTQLILSTLIQSLLCVVSFKSLW